MVESQPVPPEISYEDVILLRVPAPVAFIQLEESLDDIEESSSDVALLFWILGLLFFGLGDTISSFLVFSRGGEEFNPFMKWALSLPGGLMSFVFVKVVALSMLYATSHFWQGPHRWIIPVLMTIAGVFLTFSNTWTYLGQ